MSDGSLLDSAEFQRRAGVTRQALSKAVLARRVFYLEHAGQRGYPSFYMDPAYERSQLEAVTKLLGDLSGGAKWVFFNTPRGSLATAGRLQDGVSTESGVPRTPLQALKAGELARVRAAAIAVAES